MAPGPIAGDWPDAPTNREDFFADLEAFHAYRGTSLDSNPKVNTKSIDLFRLFQIVEGRGGYDAVSSEKLAWRKIGGEFNFGQSNAAAYAFALKTTYYKNLAAYAIKRVHKQEPPPREILEHITAKGADLLSRTIENFRPSLGREQVVNGNESDESDDDARRTPKAERMDADEPGSGAGRSRGLRQAPPQRVLFQPDVSTSRQPRSIIGHLQSPQPAMGLPNAGYPFSAAAHPGPNSFNINTYEPRQPVPLTLRPVYTPSNNPGIFKERIRKLRERHLIKIGKDPNANKGMMLPGTGFDGPNIYVRTLLALRSGITAEQDYALHHLVKISHERGDKYKFEAFPGLAEGLVEKALEVSSLFYDVQWEISYLDDGKGHGLHILDGMNGTPDILDRIRALRPLDVGDDIETEVFSRKLSKYNEAGLVIRNMSMLEENAKYLSEQYPLRDFLSIALNLPRISALVELKHYALDIAEQLTKYWSIPASDPLYASLIQYLNDGLDRGAALTALRAVCRISMNLEESNLLQNIPVRTIQTLMDWTFLEDEELVGACLDFFYQFTAVPENVATLLSGAINGSIAFDPFVTQLSRLLTYSAREGQTKRTIAPAVAGKHAAELPTMPQQLLDQILTHAEPERSSYWLRSCFEEDPESDITQIALWQAYQNQFTQYSTAANPLLAAADFIKNVSNTFTAANAQVLNAHGPNTKFIIKGIRYRRAPMDLKGQTYTRCLWTMPGSHKSCGAFQLRPVDMWEHVVTAHVGLSKTAEGVWDFAALQARAAEKGYRFNCNWASCQHFAASNGSESPYTVGRHVKTHLPDVSEMASHRARFNRSAKNGRQVPTNLGAQQVQAKAEQLDADGHPATYEYFMWNDTSVDERGHADGLPLTSALILRNLARNIPKVTLGLEAGEISKVQAREGVQPVEQFLGPLIDRLWQVTASNRSLKAQMLDLIGVIQKGMER